jgi:hypothetical protein
VKLVYYGYYGNRYYGILWNITVRNISPSLLAAKYTQKPTIRMEKRRALANRDEGGPGQAPRKGHGGDDV